MKKYLFTICIVLLGLGTSNYLVGQNKTLSGKTLFGSLRARHIGPAVMSGRVSDIAVVESDPTIMYVGAASGGVWKSVSAGASFRPIFDDYTQSIGRIVIDQNHPDTVWVGTGEPWVRNSVSVGTGIYKSTNGGGTWEFKGLPHSERISDILIDRNNPDTVYVAVQGQLWSSSEERGVYKTTDGGDNWEKVFYIDEHTGCADMAMDPEDPNTLYAAMWSHRRYPDFFDSGMKYLEGYAGKSGLYKSTDGGKTWNKIHGGLPDERMGRLAVEVAPSNGNVVYLTVESESAGKKGLYKSTDGGQSWKFMNGEFGMTVRPFYFSRINVDPNADSVVMKSGFNFSISNDGGERFRTVGSAVHSDVHCAWIDPNNSKHILIGTDGGVYESYDGGYLFKMFMNLPLSQFYHVSVDNAEPYNVYGGLQDNGSWHAPSRKRGGITNADWKSTFGGDGFYSFRHPTDENVIYAEYQGGELIRYNKKSGMAKDIKPYPSKGEEKFRFNWNAPVHQSPNNPDRLYFGSQYLFMSSDRGDSWKRISPDLTTNDPNRQRQLKSGGLSVDKSAAENNTTIYAIAESTLDENIIWAGTDDGNLQITTDQGSTWSNVALNITGLPKFSWVSFIEPGHFDKNTAFVTFDNHRNGDMTTYVYKTTDLGKTWTSVATPDIEGYALSVREDLVNPKLWFVGTEFGLYVTIDGGSVWTRFENNMPKVGVRDMVIHPREDALVMATHGRGVIIIDDINPLRQITDEVLAKKIHFFETKPTMLRDPGAGGGWFGGAGNFVGGNPSTQARIIYFMNKRHTFGRMYLEIYDEDGNKIRELAAGKSAGINIVNMPTALEKPRAAPSNNRMGLFGSIFGPNLEAGAYKVKLVKGKEEYETSFNLQYDPQSLYTLAERKVQRETTMKLYKMTEDMAYVYFTLKGVEEKSREIAKGNKKLVKKLNAFADKIEKYYSSLVGLGGDFYVAEAEAQLREKISDLYRQVLTYPGKPSGSQLDRAEALELEMNDVWIRFKEMTGPELSKINSQITKAGLEPISIKDRDTFLSGDAISAGGNFEAIMDFLH